MCEGCKELADLARQFPGTGAARIKHTRKKKPHCTAPLTCTCQHRRVSDGYVAVRPE
ncbi:hypothetical protein Shyd_65060 [Streptomyces hydrogenans]|uniref:Uncharacterized protein n=1 Tax=Streptomyces hydrogenans TaxID=1873719 RepID=A0ABQ3PJD6_9ACTN|nr:hypothetical protein GCM10018784_02610 [Streptomyces hydrogenans]GHI25135.1 hypothetical protein Shyd_65060 [Streptomyces hydrogenans]